MPRLGRRSINTQTKTTQLSPLERARTHLALAQAVLLVHQAHARLRGQCLGSQHPLVQEAVSLFVCVCVCV